MKIQTEVEFDAAHFVQTTNTKCSHLHGHGWRVVIKSKGKIRRDDGMVVDFIDIKRALRDLDHRVILPGKAKDVKIGMDDTLELKVSFYEVGSGFQKKYMFPKQDCVIVPVPVITAEWMATYIRELLKKQHPKVKFTVRVYESPKSWAEV